MSRAHQLAELLLFPCFYIATMVLSWVLIPQARTLVPFIIATAVFWAIAMASERPLQRRRQIG